jgi:hypothetical protein
MDWNPIGKRANGLETHATRAENSFFTGKGSKDVNDITQWQWANTNDVIPDKDDIVDAFAAAYNNPANGHTAVYFGLDRFDTNGDSQASF